MGKRTNYSRNQIRSRGAKKYKSKSIKSFKLDGLVKAVSDQANVNTYADAWTYSNTTNAAAKAWWCSGNATASGSFAAGTFANLMLDENQILFEMLTGAYPGNYNTTSGNSLTNISLANKRILRKSYEVKMQLVNNETSKCCITEYRCVARANYADNVVELFDQLATLSATGTSALETAAYQNPQVAAAPAISTKSGGGWPVQYGVTPFMLHTFTQRFKIKKVKAHNLEPGKHKTITYRSMKPRMFSYQQIFQLPESISVGAATSANVWGIRKGQAFSLFVCNGTWATYASGSAGYKHGISNINIGSIVTHKVHYDVFTAALPTSNVYNNVPGFTNLQGVAPLAIFANQPISAISVGASAAGTRNFADYTQVVNNIDAPQSAL